MGVRTALYSVRLALCAALGGFARLWGDLFGTVHALEPNVCGGAGIPNARLILLSEAMSTVCNFLPVRGSVLVGTGMNIILRIVIGVVVGGGLGFAYYKFVGCSTGTCPLTSNPFISTIYGGIVGALVAGSFH